jgi:hypothetical protein
LIFIISFLLSVNFLSFPPSLLLFLYYLVDCLVPTLWIISK